MIYYFVNGLEYQNMSIIPSNMAKLYAEITSDKGGRVASKGGNEYVQIVLSHGNDEFYVITWHGNYLRVSDAGGKEELYNSLNS